MKIARYEVGEVIFHEGEKTQEAFRILCGRVEITIPGRMKPIILAQMSEGDIFGEMAMVDERPRSATARCVEEAECEVMGPTDFQRAILQDPHRLLPYLSAFFERLRTVNDRLHLELRLRAESRAATISQQMAPPAPKVREPSPVPSVEHHPERIRKPVPFPPMHAMTQKPESQVHTLRVSPLDPLCASKFEVGFGPLKIEKFPFRIGRGGAGENGERHSVFSANDFLIADHEPYQISRSHCSIEREGDHFFVKDRGSTLGTIINGTTIGVQHSCLTVDLQAGENTLVLGSARSPYKFKIELE